jgi:Protein of unknown function (DUF2924)
VALNIDYEVAQMQRMTVGELQQKFAEVHREMPRSRNRQWMIKRIAWRMQSNEEGGLSERALRRAMELANDADLRLTAPRKRNDSASSEIVTAPTAPLDRRLPMPGTLITRKYKGETIQVKILPNGFEYQGERYKSLSAIAKAITGAHWNGFHFFGLNKTEACA